MVRKAAKKERFNVTPGDLVALRTGLGMTQGEFWPRFGVSDSAGGRFENGAPVRATARRLLEHFLRGDLTLKHLEWASRQALDASGGDFARLRSRHRLGQTEFWPLFGMSQSNGCRIETGAKTPGRPLCMLFALVRSKRLSIAQLEETLGRASPAGKAKDIRRSK